MYKCFYHNKDLDGRCSGAIVKKKFPDCKMIGLDYGDPFPWEEITKDDIIYMVDFSRDSADELFKIEDSCKKFILIDHHISILLKLGVSERKLKNAHIDTSIAACEKAWQVLFPGIKVPIAVTLISKYDIWDHEDENVVSLQMGLLSCDTDVTSNIWEPLFGCREVFHDFIWNILLDGKRILKYQEGIDKWAMNFSFAAEWEGLRFLCLNNVRTGSPQFNSKFDPKIHDAMLVFYRTLKKKWSIHMYTQKKDVDLSVIAVKYGGGGHKTACACELDNLPF